MKAAKDLEIALSDDGCSDIDGYMLAEEMEAVKFLIPDTLNKPVDILRHILRYLGSYTSHCEFLVGERRRKWGNASLAVGGGI